MNKLKNRTSLRNQEVDSMSNIFKKKSNCILICIAVLLLIVFSSLYLVEASRRNRLEVESYAMTLTQSVIAVMDESTMNVLSEPVINTNTVAYQQLQNQLIDLVDATPYIQSSYFVRRLGNNQMVKLIGSSSEALSASTIASLSEVIFTRTNHSNMNPIDDGIAVVLPIDVPSFQTFYVVDFTESVLQQMIWEHMIIDIIAIIGVIVLSILSLFVWVQNSKNKYLAKKLTMSEEFYRAIFDKAPVGIAITDSNGLISQSSYHWITLNKKFEEIVGRTAKELTDTPWMDITHPDDLQKDLDLYQRLVNDEIDSYSMQKRYLKPDGSIAWVNMIISSFKQTEDELPENICIIQDITHNKEIEESLIETERSKSMIIKNLPGLTYRCKYDEDRTFLFVSSGCYELTGYKEESLLFNRDISFNDIISVEYRQALRDHWKYVLENKISFKYEYEIITADNQRKWVLEMGNGVFNALGEVEALEGIIFDISYRKEIENNLRYISEHDLWTGLYNRKYLGNVLIKDEVNRKYKKRALISVNLSTIHALTANYSFNYSQNLIKRISETLHEYSSDSRLLFNTFVNRFAFYFLDYRDQKELIDFCQAIIFAIEEQIIPEKIGGGIGILEIDAGSDLSVEQMQSRALIASEKAIKSFDREFGICFYDDDLDKLLTREKELRSELLRIATDEQESDELFLHFQPILNLKTNTIDSFEALARIETPLLGKVSPLEFIPLAEETKLIVNIGQKIIVKALNFLDQLRDEGFDEVGVSINISVIQLFDPTFAENLITLIRKRKINPQQIGIEITESIFTTDYSYINNVLEKLTNFGINVAIDDFGKGYSSLAREGELKVNCLKIDKYFVDKILSSNANSNITANIIEMAHRMGHCVVAEGVNHQDQQAYLIHHRCDHIQGYFVSRPLSSKAAVQFLREYDKEKSQEG